MLNAILKRNLIIPTTPTYNHIRPQALNQAAAALEPTTATTPAPPEQPYAIVASRQHKKRVMTQATSQLANRGGRVLKTLLSIERNGMAMRCVLQNRLHPVS
jgi:hypothetical protein